MTGNNDKSFLGTGWGFPPEFDTDRRTPELVSEEQDIQQSLFLLMSTTPGERIMNPAYGCDLQSVVFERIAEATRFKIISLVSAAILMFEPRIIVNEIEVYIISYDPGLIHIQIEYTIIKTNTRSNIVYPFYQNEGTNIR